MSARDDACTILKTLRDAGFEAFLAGGCVRDELLGLTPKDYDVATAATPDEVESLFRGTRAVGKAFGVVLVRLGDEVIEVATFREEGAYSDKRRPDEVRFSDAEHDAGRRDFTVNALFLDPLAPRETWSEGAAGRVIDYVGGQADLDSRILRAVGEASERLAEDHLRALRAVRFSARYGLAIEPATARAVRADASELAGVSRERIGDEIRRMLLHSTRGTALATLESLGLAASMLGSPAIVPLHFDMVTGAAAAIESCDDEARAIGLSLCAWMLDRTGMRSVEDVDGARRDLVRVCRRVLCLSNEETDAMRDVFTRLVEIEQEWGEAGVARRKRMASSSCFTEAHALVHVRDSAIAAAVDSDLKTLRSTSSGLAPEPLVTGDDLIAAGFAPGPKFKQILDAVYDAQLEDRVRTADEAMDFVRGL